MRRVCPSKTAVPLLGAIKPAMIQARVDLPEPLPPRTSSPSPSPIVRLTSDSARRDHGVRSLYVWVTSVSWRTARVLTGHGADGGPPNVDVIQPGW